MLFLLLILLAVSVLLQGTVTTLPLVFICLLCYLVINRGQGIFYAAFFAGLIIDIFLVQAVGVSSLFFLVFFYLVLLYQSKYEINSYPFVIVSSFMGAYLYLLIQGRGDLLIALISSVIAAVLFAVLNLKFKVFPRLA